MTRPNRMTHEDAERGSIILALLAILILTTVASVGLAAVVQGQSQTRHDGAFAQSLNNAESGLDSMVSHLKRCVGLAACTPSVTSFPVRLTSTSYTTNGWDVSACSGSGGSACGPSDIVYGLDGTIASRTFHITSTGKATKDGHLVSRTVTESVKLVNLYSVGLLGINGIDLGNGAAVQEYCDAAESNTPAGNAACAGAQNVVCNQLGGASLINAAGCVSPPPGDDGFPPGAAAAPGGAFALNNVNDINNFGQVAAEDCGNIAAGCVQGQQECYQLDAAGAQHYVDCPAVANQGNAGQIHYESPAACQSGVGADLDGLNAIVPLGSLLTLNSTIITGVQNGSFANTICDGTDTSNGLPIVIPALGSIAGVSLTTVPLNATINNLDGGIGWTPRPPDTLQIVVNGPGATGPQIDLGTPLAGLTGLLTTDKEETAISGVIYAPKSTCVINGHVDLYGSIVCGKIVKADDNSTIVVHYDLNLADGDTQQTVTVSGWNEVH